MGSHQQRVGHKFFLEVEEIRLARIKKETSKDKISAEKITNMIANHKLWKEIKESIENATKEEIDEYGK